MNLSNTITQLENIGVSLTVVEGNIKVHIPDMTKQTHPEVKDLLTELKAHKPDALRLLKQQEATTQEKAWIKAEVKQVRAILLWSELLQGYFWWLIDKSKLSEIQKDGIPIYDNREIDIMLNAPDNQARQAIHRFKKTFIGSKITQGRGKFK